MGIGGAKSVLALEDEFETLKAECEKRDIALDYVKPEALDDYIGMNSEAARAMSFPYPKELGDSPKGDWIVLDESLRLPKRVETLRHELVELDLMKRKKMGYFPAHRVALRREDIPRRKEIKMAKGQAIKPAKKRRRIFGIPIPSLGRGK